MEKSAMVKDVNLLLDSHTVTTCYLLYNFLTHLYLLTTRDLCFLTSRCSLSDSFAMCTLETFVTLTTMP